MAEAGPVLAAKIQPGSTDPVQGRILSTSRIGGSEKPCSKSVRWV
jgi:hypothetical protein